MLKNKTKLLFQCFILLSSLLLSFQSFATPNQAITDAQVLPKNVFFILASASASIYKPGDQTLLVLHNVKKHATFFSAAPERDSGFILTTDIFKNWDKLFGKEDPNAGLTHINVKATDLYGHDHALSFEVLHPYTTKLGNHAFKIVALKGDRIVPGEYIDVNLFLTPSLDTFSDAPS